jgi:hypothetical protein
LSKVFYWDPNIRPTNPLSDKQIALFKSAQILPGRLADDAMARGMRNDGVLSSGRLYCMFQECYLPMVKGARHFQHRALNFTKLSRLPV